MTEHELKIWPEYFQPVIECRKPFERRSTIDRKFFVGDELKLKEWDPNEKRYTGRECEALVTYILDGPLAVKDEALMGIKLLSVTNWNVIDSPGK